MVFKILLILLAAKIGIKYIKKYITHPYKIKKDLVRYSDTDKINVVDLPDDIYTGDDREIEDNEVYKKVYDLFIKRLLEVIPREDLDNFYRNYRIIKEDKNVNKGIPRSLGKGLLTFGVYDFENNIIDKDVYSKIINKMSKIVAANIHVLLVSATTRSDKTTGVVYSGLSQFYINKENKKKTEAYGLGLNAGVTQYYVSKYFDPEHKVFGNSILNKEEQAVAKALEMIIGEDKLRSYYFKADLAGLIRELEQYNTRENIYKFISYIDVLVHHHNDKNLSYKELDDAKLFIDMFLIDTYRKSIRSKNERESSIISEISELLPYKLK